MTTQCQSTFNPQLRETWSFTSRSSGLSASNKGSATSCPCKQATIIRSETVLEENDA
jgi:hypothetical protein